MGRRGPRRDRHRDLGSVSRFWGLRLGGEAEPVLWRPIRGGFGGPVSPYPVPLPLQREEAHGLHGKARKLVYTSPASGDVVVFDHNPFG